VDYIPLAHQGGLGHETFISQWDVGGSNRAPVLGLDLVMDGVVWLIPFALLHLHEKR
jgi:hypothetical protein